MCLALLQVLRQLDAVVIRRCMASVNTEAERVGERVLRRLTDYVVNSSRKTQLTSGKTPAASVGPSHSSGAEKRRSDDASFHGGAGRPLEKVPRLADSMGRGSGSGNFQHPPGQTQPAGYGASAQPLMNVPLYGRSGRTEWLAPPSGRGGGMMRGGGGFPMFGYRPPPSRYGHDPYY